MFICSTAWVYQRCYLSWHSSGSYSTPGEVTPESYRLIFARMRRYDQTDHIYVYFTSVDTDCEDSTNFRVKLLHFARQHAPWHGAQLPSLPLTTTCASSPLIVIWQKAGDRTCYKSVKVLYACIL